MEKVTIVYSVACVKIICFSYDFISICTAKFKSKNFKGKKMNKIIVILTLLLISINSSYAAKWAVIRTHPNIPVQCNKWGWVTGNLQTTWPTPCKPLEVAYGSEIYSIDSTDQCDDNHAATFIYLPGDKKIRFFRCE